VSDIELPVQINGKTRGTLTVSKDIDQEGALQIALQAPFVQKHVEGKDLKKVIFVPTKIINLIVK